MNTRNYLNRSYRLNEKIIRNMETLERLRAAAYNITVDLSHERVQTSAPTSSRMAYCVESIADLEKTISEQKEQLAECRKETADLIDSIDDIEARLVLKLRYLDYFSWSDIMRTLSVSESKVYRLHRMGLDILTVPDS